MPEMRKWWLLMSNPITSVLRLLRSTSANVSKFRRSTRFNDLLHFDRGETEMIARDVGLSSSDLRALISKGDSTIPLLSQRLSQFGLNEERLNNALPEVLRDMQRVCGNCSSSGKCTKDFAKKSPASKISAYCPNTHTLEALSPPPKVQTSGR